MDFTKGAIDAPREALIASLLRHGGNQRPGNSTFSVCNLYDTVGDTRYYCLTRPMWRAFIANYVKPRTWKPSKRDCDSRVKAMAADLIDAAEDLGWELGAAAWWIDYLSASLGKPHNTPLAGYHEGALAFVWDEAVREIIPEVFDPPYPNRDVAWKTVAEEVRPRGWVIAGGLT